MGLNNPQTLSLEIGILFVGKVPGYCVHKTNG